MGKIYGQADKEEVNITNEGTEAVGVMLDTSDKKSSAIKVDVSFHEEGGSALVSVYRGGLVRTTKWVPLGETVKFGLILLEEVSIRHERG